MTSSPIPTPKLIFCQDLINSVCILVRDFSHIYLFLTSCPLYQLPLAILVCCWKVGSKWCWVLLRVESVAGVQDEKEMQRQALLIKKKHEQDFTDHPKLMDVWSVLMFHWKLIKLIRYLCHIMYLSTISWPVNVHIINGSPGQSMVESQRGIRYDWYKIIPLIFPEDIKFSGYWFRSSKVFIHETFSFVS